MSDLSIKHPRASVRILLPSSNPEPPQPWEDCSSAGELPRWHFWFQLQLPLDTSPTWIPDEQLLKDNCTSGTFLPWVTCKKENSGKVLNATNFYYLWAYDWHYQVTDNNTIKVAAGPYVSAAPPAFWFKSWEYTIEMRNRKYKNTSLYKGAWYSERNVTYIHFPPSVYESSSRSSLPKACS